MTALAGGIAAALAVALAATARAPHPGRSGNHLPSAAAPRGRGDRTPAWVAEACRQMGTDAAPSAVWQGMRFTMLAAVVTATFMAGPIAAATVVAAALVGQRWLRRTLHRRRLAERDAQLPAAVERIASAIRAGASPGPALIEVARTQHGPLAEDLRSVAAGVRHGESLAVALQRWSAHPDASPDVVLAASALDLGARTGGQVARAIDGVAGTLRERRQLQAEVRALATQARSSAWLLAAAPVGFATLVAGIEPGAVQFLLRTPVGLACLTAGLALDASGLAWMARIVRDAS